MTEDELTGDALIVHVKGMDRLWPSRAAWRYRSPTFWMRRRIRESRGSGRRVPGTHVPGVITAGTFFQDGDGVFWEVHDAERTIIKLEDERYARLVIEVEDPPPRSRPSKRRS